MFHRFSSFFLLFVTIWLIAFLLFLGGRHSHIRPVCELVRQVLHWRCRSDHLASHALGQVFIVRSSSVSDSCLFGGLELLFGCHGLKSDGLQALVLFIVHVFNVYASQLLHLLYQMLLHRFELRPINMLSHWFLHELGGSICLGILLLLWCIQSLHHVLDHSLMLRS